MFGRVSVRVLRLLTVVVAICTTSSLYGLDDQVKIGDKVFTTDQASIAQRGQTPVTLPPGTEVTVTAVTDGWVGGVVQQGDKHITGWIQAKYLSRAPATTQTQTTVPAAGQQPTNTLSPSQALSRDIQRWVLALGYSEKVGRDFATMVADWNLPALKEQVSGARERYQRKELTAAEATEIEVAAVRQLCQKVGKEISAHAGADNLLGDVVRRKASSQAGYAQIIYVLANCIGLQTVPLYTNGFLNEDEPIPSPACLTGLSDGRVVLADVLMHSLLKQAPEPFVFREAYRQDAAYWDLARKGGAVPMLGRIRLLDTKGLMSVASVCVGIEGVLNSKDSEAHAAFTRAIEMTPSNAAAYRYRGLFLLNYYFAHGDDIQEPIAKKTAEERILGDLSKAIELDPKDDYAYLLRGSLYHSLNRLPEALSDYSQLIELSPKDAYAYVWRANVKSELQQYEEAVADYKRAIERKPEVVNAADHKGRTPLHYAAASGRKEIVELLLSSGGDVYIADNAGSLPSELALGKGNGDLARSALDRMEAVSAKLQTAYVWRGEPTTVFKLHVAQYTGMINAIALQSSSGLLLLSKAKGGKQKKTEQVTAPMTYGVVQRLTRKGVDVVEDGIVVRESKERVKDKMSGPVKLTTTSGERGLRDHWMCARYSQGEDFAEVANPSDVFTTGYFLIPGIRNVRIGIDRDVRITHYAGLAFVKPCIIDVLPNGTVLCREEGVVCEDKDGKSWISRRVRANERDIIAFFPKTDAEAPSGRAAPDPTFSGQSSIENDADPYVGRGIGHFRSHRALQLAPRDVAAHCEQGIACALKGSFDEAIGAYTEAIRSDPKCALAYCARALAYLEKKDRDKAVADCQEAIRLDPNLAEGYYCQGVANLSVDADRTDRIGLRNSLRDAVTSFTEAIRLNPELSVAYTQRGGAYLIGGPAVAGLDANDKAIADFNVVIRLNPKWGRAYCDRGNASALRNDHAKAIADYSECIRLSPKWAQAYCNRANVYDDKGDREKAIADYMQAIRLDPERAWAFWKRIHTQIGKREFAKAIDYCTQAMTLEPTSPVPYCARGEVFDAKGDRRKALADYSEAIRLDQKCAMAYFSRATVFAAMGDTDKAIADYTEAVTLHDKRVAEGCYYNRGNLYLQKNEYAKAISDYTETIRLNPKLVGAYCNRGTAYFRSKDLDKSIADYTDAVRIDPTLAQAYLGRARVYMVKGDLDNLKRDMAIYQRLKPE